MLIVHTLVPEGSRPLSSKQHGMLTHRRSDHMSASSPVAAHHLFEKPQLVHHLSSQHGNLGHLAKALLDSCSIQKRTGKQSKDCVLHQPWTMSTVAARDIGAPAQKTPSELPRASSIARSTQGANSVVHVLVVAICAASQSVHCTRIQLCVQAVSCTTQCALLQQTMICCAVQCVVLCTGHLFYQGPSGERWR